MTEIQKGVTQHKVNMTDQVTDDVKTDNAPTTTTSVIGDSVAHEQIAKTLGDKIETPRYTKELDAIIEYVQRTKGAKDLNETLWEVRFLSNQLGKDSWGGLQVSRVYRYVYLQNEKSSIDRELNQMEALKQ
jgi:hypothetical protein